jgi:hypothetical protein
MIHLSSIPQPIPLINPQLKDQMGEINLDLIKIWVVKYEMLVKKSSRIVLYVM